MKPHLFYLELVFYFCGSQNHNCVLISSVSLSGHILLISLRRCCIEKKYLKHLALTLLKDQSKIQFNLNKLIIVVGIIICVIEDKTHSNVSLIKLSTKYLRYNFTISINDFKA